MKTTPSWPFTITTLNVVWSIRARLAVIMLAVLAAPFTANGQTVRYRVVPLTEIASAQTSCVPTAINANGDVVGYCGASELESFAVRWQSDGTVENLGKWQSGTFSHATGINVLGQVVGDGDDGDLKSKVLVLRGNGWLDIDNSGGSYQTAAGITDSGVIFGNFSTVGSPATETWDPVYWTYDADHDRYDRHDLPKAPGTPATGFSGAMVFAVNSVGVAVGQAVSDLIQNRAGLWRNDPSHTLVILGTIPGGGSTLAFGVSNDGRVVGMTYGVAQFEHAILWQNDAGHTAVDLGTLPGDLRSEAYGVNVAGQVVGASFGSVGRGFIYQNATLTELTTLLDTPYSAWTINEPAGINNTGTIIAVATLNGVRHPVMLVPFEKVKSAQTISFTLPAGPFKFGDSSFEASATSTSGLTVAFEASGACSVVGTTVTIVGAGTCTVMASQDGNADWEPAADVVENVTIGKGEATVSFDAPSLAQTFDGAVKTVETSTTPAGLPVGLSFTGTPLNAGSYPVTATIDDVNYEGTASATLVIGKADASIVVTPYSVTYDGASHTATAVATGVAGEDLSGLLSLDGTRHTDAGTYDADAWSFAGGTNYNDENGTVSNSIAPAAQAITFGALADRAYGDPAFGVSAEGGASGNAVTFIATGNCSISGNQVTITGVGSCTVTASQAGNANYAAAPDVAQSFAIAQAAQSITFGALANRTFGDAPFTVSASGGASGNAVSFAAAGNCSISGNQVTITGAGSCTVTASQAGNANYAAAPDVPQSFAIAQAAQSIIFDALANRTFGDAPFTVSASGGASGNAVTFAATGNCSVSGNLVTITGAGSCTVTASQASNANYAAATDVPQSFAIAQAAQSIVFDALANRTFGDAPFTVSASGGGSGNPVAFAAAGNCSVSGNLVTLTAAGSCTITASQAGNANYLPAAPVSQGFTIAPGAPAESPLVNPGPQINMEGDQVELRLVETRVRGEFSASNLPDRLRIDNRGAIRGHVGRNAAAGSPYLVTVTYTGPDGVSSTVAFSWTILPSDRNGSGGKADVAEKDDHEKGDKERDDREEDDNEKHDKEKRDKQRGSDDRR